MEKIAVVDIGTTSLRLQIVNVKEGGYFEIVEEIEQFCRLGKDVEKDGLLKVNRIDECLVILKMFRKICDNNKVTKILAFATSVVREAKNQTSFIDEVYNSCGFLITVLSPEEELRAVYSGVVNTVDIPKGLIINISSSSTQIIRYNRRYILNSITIPVGALTLAEKYENENIDNIAKLNNMQKDFVNLISDIDFIKEGIEPEVQFVGAGSTFKILGKLARKVSKYPLDLENNYVVNKQLFDGVYNFLSTLDLDKTKKIKGISEDRADLVLSGMAIVSAFYEVVKAEEVSICANGIREGFVYNYVVPETNEKPLSDMIGYSLDNIRCFYDRENSNTLHVYNLAIIIFKQLKVIHKLHRFYVKPLRVAASLYECGKRIKFENYEKNDFEVILNSNINGVSQRELLLGAFIGMCQNPDNFNLSDWMKYKDIVSDEDLVAVRKLGILLKLASALDRTRTGAVEDIDCDILGDAVIVKTIVKKDASFEIMEAKKIVQDFKKIFKRNLEII